MPKQRKGTEGRIIGEESDESFHDPILGDDEQPSDAVEEMRRQARELGLDPEMIRRIS